MRLRPALASVLLASALASPLVIAGTAHAETWSHRDAVRDVVALSEVDEKEVTTPAPKNRRADVRRITVAHSDEVLTITMRLRDLARGHKISTATLRGSESTMAFASLIRVHGKTRVQVQSVTEDGVVRCRGAEGVFRPRRDTVAFTIPTSCLGNPDWVRVSAIYVTFGNTPANAENVKIDDPLRRGLRPAPSRTVWSPRIHVG
jgi:hypothetical protein